MTKICQGGILVPEGATSWTIPYTPSGEGERACLESGGTIVEETGSGCGSTASVQMRTAAPTPGTDALVEGAFAPARKLRDSLAGTEFVRDLDVINDSPEVAQIISDDESISGRLTQVVGMTSGFAVDLLVGTDGPPTGVTYSAELHEWFAGLAWDVHRKVDDADVKAAIDRVVARMEGHAGSPVGEVYRSLRKEAASSGA